jgi:hypothetical protein
MPRKSGVSNRVRKLRVKALPAAPRYPQGDATVRVAKVVPEAAPPEPIDRDGLVWLHKKKRLTAAQAMKGFQYRDLFRQAREGGAIPSNIPTGRVGGGQTASLPFSGGFSESAAKLALFVVRWNVLLGQSDLLTVMDGVCGVGHTVRYLAGGEQLRAAQLEAALRIALDMMIASDKAKDEAKARLSGKVA